MTAKQMTARKLTKQVSENERERKNMLRNSNVSVKLVKKSSGEVASTLQVRPSINLQKSVKDKIDNRTNVKSQAVEAFRALFVK